MPSRRDDMTFPDGLSNMASSVDGIAANITRVQGQLAVVTAAWTEADRLRAEGRDAEAEAALANAFGAEVPARAPIPIRRPAEASPEREAALRAALNQNRAEVAELMDRVAKATENRSSRRLRRVSAADITAEKIENVARQTAAVIKRRRVAERSLETLQAELAHSRACEARLAKQAHELERALSGRAPPPSQPASAAAPAAREPDHAASDAASDAKSARSAKTESSDSGSDDDAKSEARARPEQLPSGVKRERDESPAAEPRLWTETTDLAGVRHPAGYKVLVDNLPSQMPTDVVSAWIRARHCPEPADIFDLAGEAAGVAGRKQICLTFCQGSDAAAAKRALKGVSLLPGASGALTITKWPSHVDFDI